MKFHKIEVARKQPDTAIALFFADGDPCSIITLAAASEEVLGQYDDGTWVADNPNNMFNRMFEAAKAHGLGFDSKKEFSQRLVNVTKNSLKQAHRADEQFICVNQEEAVFRLLRAILNCQVASREPYTDSMNRLETWLRTNRPEYIGAASGGTAT